MYQNKIQEVFNMNKLVMLCEILGITEEMLVKVMKGEAKLTYI